MANDLHRYGIMIHRKGHPYEDDYLFRDNKHFRIREFSHDAAEAVLKILKILKDTIVTKDIIYYRP